MPTPLSRRDALRGLGLLGLGTAAAPAVLAGAPWPIAARDADDHDATPTPYYRAEIGDITAHVFRDTVFNIPAPAFATNAEEGAIQGLLAAHNLPTDAVATPVNVLLLETGGERVLIDTGVGENGQLLGGLAAAGLAPDDIDTVVLSHFHGDHIGGVVRDGAPSFPNATYHFPAPEKAFLDGYEPSDNEQANRGVAMALGALQPLMDAGVLSLFEDGAQLAAGVAAKAAHGHTPGHMAFQVASGGERLLVTADAANHYVATFARPEWIFAFDAIPEQTVATRRALYGMASDDGVRVWGTHMPFPGFGMAVRDDPGFRFITAP